MVSKILGMLAVLNGAFGGPQPKHGNGAVAVNRQPAPVAASRPAAVVAAH